MGAPRFTKAQVAQALAGVEQAGLPVFEVRLDPEGVMSIITAQPKAPLASNPPKAPHAAPKQWGSGGG